MTKLTADAFRWTRDSDGGWLCIRCADPDRILDEIQTGKVYDVEIKQHRERRSLDANAYLWVLLDKLAAKLTAKGAPVSKVDIYRRMIRDVPGSFDTVCVVDAAVDKLRQSWERNGTGWLTDTIPSKLDGCTNVLLYYGSSAYDTRQFSRLVDLVVFECRQQGIETLTPREIARTEDYDGRRY